MNITRNNYEEQFLLYADGELNPTDKAAVDQFVRFHPDLAEELDMLLETILDTTNITMPGKNLLLKSVEWNEESLSANQQDLLLLLDKELPAERVAALQVQIKSDAALQEEWAILQQTKLPASVVEMPEKENLYRKERDRRPIPIGFVRWMAAAALIAGAGWFSISFFSTDKGTNDGVATLTNQGKVVKPEIVIPATVVVPPIKKDNAEVQQADQQQTARVAKNEHQVKPAYQAVVAGKSKTVFKRSNPERILINNNQAGALTLKQQLKIEAIQRVDLPTENIAANIENVKAVNNNSATKVTEPKSTELAIAQPAVYNEDSADEAEYVNIAGAHIKKQKLRSIFRNVTRTVGRSFDKSNVAQADVASLNK